MCVGTCFATIRQNSDFIQVRPHLKGGRIFMCRVEEPNPDACPLFDSDSDSDSDGTADEGSDSDSDQVDILWSGRRVTT